MSANNLECPIWGSGYSVEGYYKPQNRTFHVENSPRTGGGYVLPEATKNAIVENLSPEQKARLTTWLIDQRKQGNERPTITEQVVRFVTDSPPLPANDRAARLLEFIAKSATVISTRISVSSDTHDAFAYSESTSWEEVEFLIRYLERRGWIGCQHTGGSMSLCTVTVDGYSHIAELTTNLNASQAFIAMWFDETMEVALEQAICPAVEDAGFNPMRIDRKEHINKIEDEIIAEIRRSRFLIADFTHGEDGARGGVYYEAGFAHGLGIPVIFTCRADAVDTLHFDTNHYNHIVWATPEELRERLKNRILAVIGEGPSTHISSNDMVIP
ncbi:MAG: hypothetical protein OXI54_05395 [Chloroflexota bacterium]|nr:hypothetical protein [Chloroflexota bacterium]MDE2683566.1 hypothetical protein [Chloroflexota bacterium]